MLISQPIFVRRDATDEEVDAKQRSLQLALEDLTREGESWRSSKNLRS
jgi:hypothetical protein